MDPQASSARSRRSVVAAQSSHQTYQIQEIRLGGVSYGSYQTPSNFVSYRRLDVASVSCAHDVPDRCLHPQEKALEKVPERAPPVALD